MPPKDNIRICGTVCFMNQRNLVATGKTCGRHTRARELTSETLKDETESRVSLSASPVKVSRLGDSCCHREVVW